ncbi:hypothetical protein [Frankia sp. QA3]|uniref:hypothetical protein n=1 Tax=Frankia sp. QA3 TaxID=710111 RepID=UPI00350F7D0D
MPGIEADASLVAPELAVHLYVPTGGPHASELLEVGQQDERQVGQPARALDLVERKRRGCFACGPHGVGQQVRIPGFPVAGMQHTGQHVQARTPMGMAERDQRHGLAAIFDRPAQQFGVSQPFVTKEQHRRKVEQGRHAGWRAVGQQVQRRLPGLFGLGGIRLLAQPAVGGDERCGEVDKSCSPGAFPPTGCPQCLPTAAHGLREEVQIAGMLTELSGEHADLGGSVRPSRGTRRMVPQRRPGKFQRHRGVGGTTGPARQHPQRLDQEAAGQVHRGVDSSGRCRTRPGDRIRSTEPIMGALHLSRAREFRRGGRAGRNGRDADQNARVPGRGERLVQHRLVRGPPLPQQQRRGEIAQAYHQARVGGGGCHHRPAQYGDRLPFGDGIVDGLATPQQHRAQSRQPPGMGRVFGWGDRQGPPGRRDRLGQRPGIAIPLEQPGQREGEVSPHRAAQVGELALPSPWGARDQRLSPDLWPVADRRFPGTKAGRSRRRGVEQGRRRAEQFDRCGKESEVARPPSLGEQHGGPVVQPSGVGEIPRFNHVYR